MEAIPSFLLEYGLPGVIILVLGWMLKDRLKFIDELQDKRLSEFRDLLQTTNDNTNALRELTNLIRDRRGGA